MRAYRMTRQGTWHKTVNGLLLETVDIRRFFNWTLLARGKAGLGRLSHDQLLTERRMTFSSYK